MFDDYKEVYRDDRSFSGTFGENSFEFTESCFSKLHSSDMSQGKCFIT